jgi:uridylate kinase
MYKRVLIKLSGQQLAGKYEGGFDADLAGWFAEEIKPLNKKGIQIVIMVGGGNIVRGAQIAGHGIQRVTADHMGMLGTMINALALTDIFEAHGVPTRCLSNIFAEQVAEPFVYRLALKHLDKGRVIIIAGGIGRPYLTTDTAAVSLALELDCNLVMKATKFDGVYEQNPSTNNKAKKFDHLTHQQAVENSNIKVMDQAALGLAMEHGMDLIIFDALGPNNIANAVSGLPVGTKISN